MLLLTQKKGEWVYSETDYPAYDKSHPFVTSPAKVQSLKDAISCLISEVKCLKYTIEGEEPSLDYLGIDWKMAHTKRILFAAERIQRELDRMGGDSEKEERPCRAELQ